jgi:hypothetical protein
MPPEIRDAAYYLENAQRCLKAAAAAKTPAEKKQWQQIAATYAKLAEAEAKPSKR